MVEKRVQTKESWRFKWDHTSRFHRLAVRTFNRIMPYIPFVIKYRVGKRLRMGRLPYALVADARVAVQVGAPKDTLRGGRSRGMYFALFARTENKVIIVEPDANSTDTMKRYAQQHDIGNLHVINCGAWSETKSLILYIDDNHPASNFTEGTVDYSEDRLKDYRVVEVPVDTLDNLLEAYGLDQIDLVSITTNGSEPEILKGMSRLMAAGLRYIALARTGEDYHQLMADYGYAFLSHDDRGYVYQRREQCVAQD